MDEQSVEAIEIEKLRFANLLLKSESLEKKMKAIAVFKEQLDENRKIGLSKDKFARFLIENQLAEYLLGENFHSEIFRISAVLFRFLIEKTTD